VAEGAEGNEGWNIPEEEEEGVDEKGENNPPPEEDEDEGVREGADSDEAEVENDGEKEDGEA